MRKTILIAALLSATATGALAKKYHGDYTVTFLIDPGGSAGASYCLKLTPTGTVANFSESGTFQDTEGDGLAGQYLVDGKSFHVIFDNIGGGSEAIDMIGKGGTAPSGAFDDFEVGSSGADLDSGTFTLTPGCTDGHHTRPVAGHSVTQP